MTNFLELMCLWIFNFRELVSNTIIMGKSKGRGHGKPDMKGMGKDGGMANERTIVHMSTCTNWSQTYQVVVNSIYPNLSRI